MVRIVTAALALLTTASAPALAGSHEIVVKSAIIADSKSNGAGWDAFKGAPDPFVIGGVSAGGGFSKGGTSSVPQDTYRPNWNETVAVADVGDDIVLQVWDEDIAADDPIGEYKFTLAGRIVADQELRIAFDQVKELRIFIRPAR